MHQSRLVWFCDQTGTSQDNLNNQVNTYARLINLLQQENQTLITRKHDQLNEITSQKEDRLELVAKTDALNSKPFELLVTNGILAEKEPNQGFTQAQELTIPSIVLGKIQANQDVDVFKIINNTIIYPQVDNMNFYKIKDIKT